MREAHLSRCEKTLMSASGPDKMGIRNNLFAIRAASRSSVPLSL